MTEQRTDEWFAKRCGKFTGSTFNDLIAVKKDGKPTQKREDLIWSVTAERVQGYQPKGPSSFALSWGVDVEPLARQAYEFRTGEFVDEVDFIEHPDHPYVGISPDGLVGEDGGIEIKSPKNPQIHLQRWLYGVPEEYMAQIQGAMWVTGRKWWDFVSYDPDTAPEYQLLIIRVERDEKFIENLKNAAVSAEAEVVALLKSLREKVGAENGISE